MAVVIRQVRCIDAQGDRDWVADVWIEAGKFRAIAPRLDNLPPHLPELDGQGCYLLPGLVDLYSYSGEPGAEDRETLASLSAAALAGGFTRVALRPDTQPPLDTLTALQDFHHRCQGPDRPHLLPWAAPTQGGTTLVEMGELTTWAAARNQGSLPRLAGFLHPGPLPPLELVRRILEYGQPLGAAIALWPWNDRLGPGGVARAGALAQVAGLREQPRAAETAPLAALLELVAEIGTPIHLMRLSTARSVALVAQAKAQGLPITASVSWLHLLFSTQDCLTYDPHLRLEPPLGNPADQAALVEAVATGVIDAIAIDHTPHPYEDKTVPFDQAPPGAIGLESALAALWQRFVTPGPWSPLTLVRALSSGPARCLGWTGMGAIAAEAPAEAVLFDPRPRQTLTPTTLHSRCHNTPFLGQTLQGQVQRIWMPWAGAAGILVNPPRPQGEDGKMGGEI